MYNLQLKVINGDLFQIILNIKDIIVQETQLVNTILKIKEFKETLLNCKKMFNKIKRSTQSYRQYVKKEKILMIK